MSRSYRTLALTLFWLLARSSLASAHAFPDHAEPRVGATLVSLTTAKGSSTFAPLLMKRLQHSLFWRRGIALFGICSLLLFAAVSTTHLHNPAPHSGARQDCKLCVTGSVHLTVISSGLVLTALVFLFFSSLLPTPQLCSARYYQPANPRSPPVFS